MRDLVCAVDVGTGSARAGIFDRTGRLAARAEHAISLSRPVPGHAEHDSEQIWIAVCLAIRSAMKDAGAGPDRVAALAFDATCSLVARGENGTQISVSQSGQDHWDTIAWLDHRAQKEADECTATGHHVLDHVGKVMSPEMQTPKLMWLKRALPGTWRSARLFFDLADFLAWKATGTNERSLSTLAAKWTYLPHCGGWQRDFFNQVGLADMLEKGGMPESATPAGASLGPLLPGPAQDMGLDTNCVVATGLIDAFAGTLGTIGGVDPALLENHVALIAGTSSCVAGMAREMRLIHGIWGPYHGAALPGMWLWEAGQSTTGALLDHVIHEFGGGRIPDASTHREIADRVVSLRKVEGQNLAADIHVLPDFLGNRSPLADPGARGVISGLTLDNSFDGLCRIYWRTAVAIALGIRHNLDYLHENGIRADAVHVAGGHRQNPLLMELYADILGRTIHEPQCPDAILLGTAMCAAAAAGWHEDLPAACRAMQCESKSSESRTELSAGYDRDYRIFLKMIEHRKELSRLQ